MDREESLQSCPLVVDCPFLGSCDVTVDKGGRRVGGAARESEKVGFADLILEVGFVAVVGAPFFEKGSLSNEVLDSWEFGKFSLDAAIEEKSTL